VADTRWFLRSVGFLVGSLPAVVAHSIAEAIVYPTAMSLEALSAVEATIGLVVSLPPSLLWVAWAWSRDRRISMQLRAPNSAKTLRLGATAMVFGAVAIWGVALLSMAVRGPNAEPLRWVSETTLLIIFLVGAGPGLLLTRTTTSHVWDQAATLVAVICASCLSLRSTQLFAAAISPSEQMTLAALLLTTTIMATIHSLAAHRVFSRAAARLFCAVTTAALGAGLFVLIGLPESLWLEPMLVATAFPLLPLPPLILLIWSPWDCVNSRKES